MALELTNTWGTDKAIIEAKALDKQGDTMTGDLVMKGDLIMQSCIQDANGEQAIDFDKENKSLGIYGFALPKFEIGICNKVNNDTYNVPLHFHPKGVICSINGICHYMRYGLTSGVLVYVRNVVYGGLFKLKWEDESLTVTLDMVSPPDTIDYIVIG